MRISTLDPISMNDVIDINTAAYTLCADSEITGSIN
jgi:hypothetical protein